PFSALLFLATPPTLRSPLFPYTTLFRSRTAAVPSRLAWQLCAVANPRLGHDELWSSSIRLDLAPQVGNVHSKILLRVTNLRRKIDRKSTRLNSSHGSISYAVFCLKKKNS